LDPDGPEERGRNLVGRRSRGRQRPDYEPQAGRYSRVQSADDRGVCSGARGGAIGKAAVRSDLAEIEKLRGLPSVDEALGRFSALDGKYPRRVVVAEIRRALEEARTALRSGGSTPDWESRVREALDGLTRSCRRRVINATGVVLHTNLGRAPLGPQSPIPGYSNLEE